MKQKIYLLLLWFFYLSSYAQPPQGIGYQSIARNGTPIINTTIGVKVSILKDPGAVLVYSETHAVLTNGDGLYSISIGNGTVVSGTFSTINWGAETKQLKIEISPTNNGTYLAGLTTITPFATAPFALMAKTVETMSNFSMCDNIYALKSIYTAKPNDVVYMRGYYAPGDAGGGLFMWKTDAAFRTDLPGGPGYFSTPNDGTIIQSYNTGLGGRWVRQYDGDISTAYFGTLGDWRDSTVAFQSAIDFAKLVANSGLTYFTSSTVFIPNGVYTIDKITLRSGVSIVGENIGRTVLRAIPGSPSPYMVYIEPGMVTTNVSNLNFSGWFPLEGGGVADSDKGVFYIEGSVGPYGAGGLTNSTFKNIIIERFKGSCIVLKGGTGGYLPNDTTIFENVRAFRYYQTNPNYSLFIENDGRQYSFVNCQFDGGSNPENIYYKASTGYNVYIKGNDAGGYVNPNTITFHTSTFQNADYGIYIERAENVTFDTCWFESLGVGVFVDGTNRPCKGINVNNCRFANVPGYGGFDQYIDSSYKLTDAYCIMSKNSVVNAANNLVVNNELHTNCGFAYAYDGNLGMNLSNNSFIMDSLAKTYGTMQTATQSGTTLDCKQNNEISATGSGTIATLTSSINTGEIVMIKAASTLVFSKTATGSNITFPGSLSTLTLSSGQVAEFMKTDLSGAEVFQLVRIRRTN